MSRLCVFCHSRRFALQSEMSHRSFVDSPLKDFQVVVLMMKKCVGGEVRVQNLE